MTGACISQMRKYSAFQAFQAAFTSEKIKIELKMAEWTIMNKFCSIKIFGRTYGYCFGTVFVHFHKKNCKYIKMISKAFRENSRQNWLKMIAYQNKIN